MTIHHFGLVVRSIQAYLPRSVWELRGQIVTDPLQSAKLCMVGLPGDAHAPLVELIEPLGPDGPCYRAQSQDPLWHHVCFTFRNRGEADLFAEQGRMLGVTEWKPAVLFGGRPVRFVYGQNRELIELISDEVLR
jgi:hypothetical protein